jgi:chromosome segregation ATPase
LEGTKKELEAQ